MKRKLVSGLLVASMAFSLLACGSKDADTESADAVSSESADGTTASLYQRTGDVATDSEYLYNANLGEFYEAYEIASAETDLDQRYALMAIAEAKLLETGMLLPDTSQGGYYGLRRNAPYSVATVNWGMDSELYYNMIVTNEMIKADDYNYLKSQWGELKGTGTYEETAKEYLTNQGYTLKDTYAFSYNSDATTYDAYTTFLAADIDIIGYSFDTLLSYDCENELQPALAESYEVSDDGLTYTFHLREGLKWVDSQGRELADLTADDFVAGMQHFLEGQSGMEYLAGADGAKILNADEYYLGDITDFDEVGVKALDDLTVQYTLYEPCPYFETLLTYTTFAPLCRSYFLSVGGGFGGDYDSTTCQYGIDPDHIAYCGPYLITSAVSKNSIVYEANPTYWNADGINVKKLTMVYNDGSDPTKGYNDFMNGTTDTVSLDASTLEVAQGDGVFDDYAIISGVNSTAYTIFTNINRTAFANSNDDTTVVSTQTEEEKELTYAAMNNQHFRLALCYGLDRTSYNAQVKGDELASVNIINSYTNGTFVSLSKEVTVDINGEATTFPAGTWYGEILQAQITADGYPMQVFDTSADNGVGASAGYDGWYNPDQCAAELAIAVEELAAEGYDVTTDNPVVIDLPTATFSETYTNKANAYKQSIEASTGGLVRVNLVECVDTDEYYYTQYYCTSGTEMNYDIGAQSGWSADFGDPSTFLTTVTPDGYWATAFGLY